MSRALFRVLTASIACMLSGCGQSTPIPSYVSAGADEVSTAVRTSSWMAPGASKQQSLLYVTNFGSGKVGVYSYDAGTNLEQVGSLDIPEPSGVCTDKNGHVWVASQHGRALHEFERGSTKQITLIKLYEAGFPAGCATDPTTGDLAVAINKPNAKFIGHYASVIVFPYGSSRGQEYDYSGGFYSVSFPAFDDKGDLFVDGTVCRIYYYCYTVPDTPPGLFELAKGSGAFVELRLKGVTFDEPAGLAWINPTLLVAEDDANDSGEVVGYKMLISGGSATLVETIPFKSTRSASGITVRADVVAIADMNGPAIRTYSVMGGTPIDSELKGLSAPYAVAVSQAKVK